MSEYRMTPPGVPGVDGVGSVDPELLRAQLRSLLGPPSVGVAESGAMPASFGVLPPVPPAGGLAGLGLMPPSPGNGGPIVFREIHQTVLHSQGKELPVVGREDVRILDPQTGAQTFVSIEHRYMSADGYPITNTTVLYECQRCGRARFVVMRQCLKCGRLLCAGCVKGVEMSDGSFRHYCTGCKF